MKINLIKNDFMKGLIPNHRKECLMTFYGIHKIWNIPINILFYVVEFYWTEKSFILNSNTNLDFQFRIISTIIIRVIIFFSFLKRSYLARSSSASLKALIFGRQLHVFDVNIIEYIHV